MTNDVPGSDTDLVRPIFEQLMEHVRKQDDLIHSWTKYYLSVQAALAVALSFLIKLGSAEDILVNTGSVFIPFLGIVTSICLTNIILREHFWQGRYITQIIELRLKPEAYRAKWVPKELDFHHHGYISKQFRLLRYFLITGWAIWSLALLYRAICHGRT
jgi:hypothetical protein